MDKNKNKKPILYLIPNVISEDTAEKVISQEVRGIIPTLDYFIVENVRTARRFISSLKLGVKIDDLHFEVLDKNTQPNELPQIMKFIEEGKSAGVISEAGCPGIADPGAMAVQYAHQVGIRVVPVSGPSSIFLGLMASGFNGQRFAFHGYLPIDKNERRKAIKELEKESLRMNQTQIFMETPYRNEKLFLDLLRDCHSETRLCIAQDITGSMEKIQTLSIQEWKKRRYQLEKAPTVFLISVP